MPATRVTRGNGSLPLVTASRVQETGRRSGADGSIVTGTPFSWPYALFRRYRT
jgi:hypothetical protein